jgi:hypothetical protein
MVLGRERRNRVRTSGIPGFVTYDETPINVIWDIVKFREDCIRDPVCMAVDAHEQDRATAKKRFTLKIILLRPRRTQTNERDSDNDGSAESGCTYCRGELSVAWPIILVPSHAYDPARLILSYFWMSKKI